MSKNKKLLIKVTAKLLVCDVNLRVLTFFYTILFSRAKKATKPLRYANNLLTTKLCRRQRLYEQWNDIADLITENNAQV
jgi:hypothetical protein